MWRHISAPQVQPIVQEGAAGLAHSVEAGLKLHALGNFEQEEELPEELTLPDKPSQV